MPLAVDIKVLGDKELEHKMQRFEPRVQKKVMRQAMKKSILRVKPKILQKISGSPIGVETGRLLAAMQAAKPKSATKDYGRDVVGYVLDYPTRAELGIPAGAKGYYPAVLEYGSAKAHIPAFSWIRVTVNSATPSERASIAREAHKGIEKEWRKR